MQYVLTFNIELSNFEKPLGKVVSIGAKIISFQQFLGTAIIEADPQLKPQIEQIYGICAVEQTGSTRAA